jgi:hypothetical protein
MRIFVKLQISHIYINYISEFLQFIVITVLFAAILLVSDME